MRFIVKGYHLRCYDFLLKCYFMPLSHDRMFASVNRSMGTHGVSYVHVLYKLRARVDSLSQGIRWLEYILNEKLPNRRLIRRNIRSCSCATTKKEISK